jgi:hypothetical protein
MRDGASEFASPPKEDVLRSYIALTNPMPSTGFETENFGSNIKHANH